MSDRSGVMLSGPFEGLVGRYGEWLVAERGLAVRTIEYYVPEARRFLAGHEGRELGSLTLGDVTTYVVGECRRCSYGRARPSACELSGTRVGRDNMRNGHPTPGGQAHSPETTARTRPASARYRRDSEHRTPASAVRRLPGRCGTARIGRSERALARWLRWSSRRWGAPDGSTVRVGSVRMSTELTPAQASDVAREAYLFGLPLVKTSTHRSMS
jgi:hypothetical protein